MIPRVEEIEDVRRMHLIEKTNRQRKAINIKLRRFHHLEPEEGNEEIIQNKESIRPFKLSLQGHCKMSSQIN
jgi:hypothetical protein